MLKLTNIHYKTTAIGNTFALYADLRDHDGQLLISATLDYILKTIQEKKLNVEGVSLNSTNGSIRLTKY